MHIRNSWNHIFNYYCFARTGELYYMSRNFDNSYWNDPGYGIMLPMDNKKLADFVPDHWYRFEPVC